MKTDTLQFSAILLFVVLFSSGATGQISSATSGSSVPSSVVWTRDVNSSLEASANASALSVIASRMSQGSVWSEVMSEFSGPRASASAPIVLAFIRDAATSDTSEPSFSDLRMAVGMKSPGSCSLRANIEIKEKLWRSLLPMLEKDHRQVSVRLRGEFPGAAEAVEIEPPGPSTVEYLATVTRLASRSENQRSLKALSNRLFQCKGGREDAALRGAAGLVYLDAAAADVSAAPQTVTLTVYNGAAGFPPPPEPTPQERFEAANRARRHRIREQERLASAGELLHEEERPSLCLAMSGGGVRSAAFQLGILQGLAELRMRGQYVEISRLDELDIASAVSGGSYALGWLLSQDDPRKALAATNLDRTDPRKAWLTNHLEGAFGGLGAIATNLLRLSTRLEKTALPDPTLAHYFYARLLRTSFELDPRPLAELGSNFAPWPIFVTTARLGDEGACGGDRLQTGAFLGEASRLRRSVFEITPHAGGSRELGFSSRLAGDLTLPMVVATAGAALDDPHHDYCKRLRGLGVTLGTRVGRWEPESAATPRSSSGPLHLSDGGFSENLGLYPLLRRSCKTILVADASYDPDLMFTDYRRLERVLRDEGIELRNGELSGRAQTQGVECDATSDPPCFVRPSPAALASPFAARRASKSTFEGEIQMPGEAGTTIPFVVIKLAIDERNPGQYPLPVQKLIASDPRGSFPHIPTSRQKLTAEEFRALRLLGCHLVETIHAGNFEIPENSPCRAPQEAEGPAQ